MMDFEELDETTRRYMLAGFEAEESGGSPYRSDRLSSRGLAAFPDMMRTAILAGNERTLIESLSGRGLWRELEMYSGRGGGPSFRRYSIPDAIEALALTEFNTWYVRGLAKRLMDEGQTHCQVYRANSARLDRGSCTVYEDKVVSLEEIHAGHRARYWPKPGNPSAFSIPAHPLCFHTIRRLPNG
jgi:hypothetical protein